MYQLIFFNFFIEHMVSNSLIQHVQTVTYLIIMVGHRFIHSLTDSFITSFTHSFIHSQETEQTGGKLEEIATSLRLGNITRAPREMCHIYLGLANISIGVFFAHTHFYIWAVWFGYLAVYLLTNFVAEIAYHRRRVAVKTVRYERQPMKYGVGPTPEAHSVPKNHLRDLEREEDGM